MIGESLRFFHFDRSPLDINLTEVELRNFVSCILFVNVPKLLLLKCADC